MPRWPQENYFMNCFSPGPKLLFLSNALRSTFYTKTGGVNFKGSFGGHHGGDSVQPLSGGFQLLKFVAITSIGMRQNRDLDPNGPNMGVFLLWMDEILHHLRTMGNHCLLVFTGESSFQGVLRRCEMDFVHPQYGFPHDLWVELDDSTTRRLDDSTTRLPRALVCMTSPKAPP